MLEMKRERDEERERERERKKEKERERKKLLGEVLTDQKYARETSAPGQVKNISRRYSLSLSL
jgi:hypothetical protein